MSGRTPFSLHRPTSRRGRLILHLILVLSFYFVILSLNCLFPFLSFPSALNLA